MTPVWHIARKELADGLRNRWLLAISLLFALLAVGIAWFGAATAGQVGFTSIPATMALFLTVTKSRFSSPSRTSTVIVRSRAMFLPPAALKTSRSLTTSRPSALTSNSRLPAEPQ